MHPSTAYHASLTISPPPELTVPPAGARFPSWWHLTFNLLVQLAVGLPLEMAHGTGRVSAIYLAGVLAGSLGTSVYDAGRQVYLVGASGGVYALLTAHIANVLLVRSAFQATLRRKLCEMAFGKQIS